MTTNIVAVYGTLREGLNNHKLIAGCKRIGLGWLTGFRMYNLGDFPGIIPTHDESGRIRVEWYDVSDEILEELDRRLQPRIHKQLVISSQACILTLRPRLDLYIQSTIKQCALYGSWRLGTFQS